MAHLLPKCQKIEIFQNFQIICHFYEQRPTPLKRSKFFLYSSLGKDQSKRGGRLSRQWFLPPKASAESGRHDSNGCLIFLLISSIKPQSKQAWIQFLPLKMAPNSSLILARDLYGEIANLTIFFKTLHSFRDRSPNWNWARRGGQSRQNQQLGCARALSSARRSRLALPRQAGRANKWAHALDAT